MTLCIIVLLLFIHYTILHLKMAKQKHNFDSYRNDTVIMPFGKYQGVHMRDIPLDYIQWGIHKFTNCNLREAFQVELAWRQRRVL